MTFGVLGDINWLAVIVAALIYFAIGGLWYASSVFGKTWQAAGGWTAQDVEGAPAITMYAVPLVTCLLSTIALAMLAEATGTDSVGEGIMLALVAGIGLVLPTLFVTGYFDPRKAKPRVWIAVTAGYHLVGLLAAATILAAWT